MGVIKLGIIYVALIPIKFKTNVDDLNMYLPVVYFCIYIYIYMIGNKV